MRKTPVVELAGQEQAARRRRRAARSASGPRTGARTSASATPSSPRRRCSCRTSPDAHRPRRWSGRARSSTPCWLERLVDVRACQAVPAVTAPDDAHDADAAVISSPSGFLGSARRRPASLGIRSPRRATCASWTSSSRSRVRLGRTGSGTEPAGACAHELDLGRLERLACLAADPWEARVDLDQRVSEDTGRGDPGERRPRRASSSADPASTSSGGYRRTSRSCAPIASS